MFKRTLKILRCGLRKIFKVCLAIIVTVCMEDLKFGRVALLIKMLQLDLKGVRSDLARHLARL